MLYAAWLLSMLATAGSLFFSEVMSLPPCVLCWWQRIFMYPLVLLLGVQVLWPNGRRVQDALLLTVPGMGVAIYHNLLYYNIIPESLAPCTQGISCTSRQIEWLGFVTIPLMALVAFALINLALVLQLRRGTRV